MTIAVVGTGRIGSSLATAWKARGHQVTFGSRSHSGRSPVDGVQAASVEAAVKDSEVVVLAVPGSAVVELASSLPLDQKIIIDCTNGGDAENATTAQRIAERAPSAGVFKAFNTLGFENFQSPAFGNDRADLLYIGNNDDHRLTVAALIQDVGLNPVFVGGLDQQSILDAATGFWFALSRVYGRHVAYRVLSD